MYLFAALLSVTYSLKQCCSYSFLAFELQSGYMLYDRVIRPAEVGVTQAVENDATED